MNTEHKEKLKNAVRFFYDVQRLRMQSAARASRKAEAAQASLDESDKAFMQDIGDNLRQSEARALREVKRLLKGVRLWEEWLKGVKGCGPTMSGVILSEIDIEKATTPSKIWRVCGLAVDSRTGRAERKVKGERLHYSPFLKAKMVHVLAGCLIKANSPYRKYYDDYKHRKEAQRVPQCMGCDGTGKANRRDLDQKLEPGEKRVTKKVKCVNCDGTGGPAPWGASKAHRHNAAMRYMVKMFLLDLYVEWRTQEGLPVRSPYQEEYLGHVHGGSGVASQPTVEAR